MHRVIKASRVLMRETPVSKSSAPAAGEARWGKDAEDKAKRELDGVRKAADEMLALAREEASHLIRQAREEAAEITRSADKAKEKARWDAYKQGLEMAEQEIGDLFERAQEDVDRTLEQAKKQFDALMDDLEPRVFKLSLEIAEKILGYELDNNDSAFLSMLRTALGSVKNENTVTLRVNSSEYIRFFKSREVTMHTASGSLKANVVNDPNVGYGGCLIETDSGAIDAGVGAQLAQIGKNLGLEMEEHGD